MGALSDRSQRSLTVKWEQMLAMNGSPNNRSEGYLSNDACNKLSLLDERQRVAGLPMAAENYGSPLR